MRPISRPYPAAPNKASGTVPRAMVNSPFAIPYMTAKIAASAAENGNSANNPKAVTNKATAQRAIHHGCTRRANENSQIRARTCAGPNNMPIATTVAGAKPKRWKIARSWAESAEGTKA